MEEKPRYSRTSDLIHLIFLMASKLNGVTIKDIQNEFGVARRTAERMRDALLAIMPSIDEIETGDRQKHWGFVNFSVNNIVDFTEEEIAALEKIKNNFDNLTNMEIKKALSKIRTLSVNKKKGTMNNLEFLLQSEGLAVRQVPNYKIDLNDISLIREAIKTNFKLKAEYNSKERLLSPLGIIYGEKAYLIAKEEAKGQEPYVYTLHKLKKLKLSKEKFDSKDFNLKKYSEKSFGIYQGEIFKVELEFNKNVAEDVLNYNFHPTQKMKTLENGNVIVKFSASGDKHIMWNLFKWAGDVKILKPAKLKKEYKEYLENILEGVG